MITIPDETQLEHLLETLTPDMNEAVTTRLASAPWTPRAASRRRTAWAVTLATLAIALLFAVTPPGRAWAQSLLRFFTRASSNTLPYTQPTKSWGELTPGAFAETMTPEPPQAAFAAECGDFQAPTCSVEEIRAMVGFGVSELGTIPEGLYFIGATGGPDLVFVKYDSFDHSGGLVIFESPWTGSAEQTAWPVGPDAVVEKVAIGSISGEYVKGSYKIINGKGPMTWDPNFNVQTLRWVNNQDVFFNNDIFLELKYSGPAETLGRDALATLAASMTTRSVSSLLPTMPATPTPYYVDFTKIYPLTIAEAGQKAGFHVALPSRIPDVLLPAVGANYGEWYEPYHLLVIFYPIDPIRLGPGTSDGLNILEELVADPSGCALCEFRVGDSDDVKADPSGSIVGGGLENVKIGEADGQYVVGVWTGKNNNGVWYWETSYEFPKMLRWQVNGIAFQLTYWGQELEKADLIAIAESMK